jgi:hypothetical protein
MTETKRWMVLRADGISLDDIIEIMKRTVIGYEPPPVSEMASRAFLEKLSDMAAENEEVRRLLWDWKVPAKRIAMQEWSIDFTISEISYQAKTDNTSYLALFGRRGSGKSEIAQFLSLLDITIYRKFGDVNPLMGFARSPSVANEIYATATEKEKTVSVILDERERETGTGAGKEWESLIQNLDTMRVLKHSLVACAITKQELSRILSRCEIIFRPLFKDRQNRVNWCLMYVMDIDSKELVPKSIVGFPLHPYTMLRIRYEGWKKRIQMMLTEAGGRYASLKHKVKPFVDAAVDYAKEHEEYIENNQDKGVIWRHKKEFENAIMWDIEPSGENLMPDEKKAAAQRAHRLYWRWRKKQDKDERNQKSEGKSFQMDRYTGQISDIRDAIFSIVEQKGADSRHIAFLREYMADETITYKQMIARHPEWQISDPANLTRWKSDMERMFGEAFEDVYAEILASKGVRFVRGGKNTPEPDIVILDDAGNEKAVYELKCKSEHGTVIRIRKDEYATSLGLTHAKEKEIAYHVVLFDMVTNTLYEPHQVDIEEPNDITFSRRETDDV